VDVMMISHGDDDHAGGMQSIVQALPVSELVLGPSVNANQLHLTTKLQRCQQGQHWQWDGVEFEVLHPTALAEDTSRNNTSCVLRISAPGGNALLLGDAEALAEQQMLDENRIRPTSIVVAGHHGSRSSSTPAFVNALHAQQVIFSAGYRNRWDFPKSDVVQRWHQSGAQVNSTIDHGAITIRVLPQGIQAPLWYRTPQRHYWQEFDETK